jgi:hypothetical protein
MSGRASARIGHSGMIRDHAWHDRNPSAVLKVVVSSRIAAAPVLARGVLGALAADPYPPVIRRPAVVAPAPAGCSRAVALARAAGWSHP